MVVSVRKRERESTQGKNGGWERKKSKQDGDGGSTVVAHSGWWIVEGQIWKFKRKEKQN